MNAYEISKNVRKFFNSTNALVTFLVIIAGEFIHGKLEQDKTIGILDIVASICLGIIIIFHSFKVYHLYENIDHQGLNKLIKNSVVLLYFSILFVQIVLNIVAIFQNKPELQENLPVLIIKLVILCILFIVTLIKLFGEKSTAQKIKEFKKPLTTLKKLLQWSQPVIYLLLIAYMSYKLI